jgi:hypothetical protein
MNKYTAMEFPETDPRHHTRKMGHAMRGLMEHLREDAQKVSETRAKVLFETSAEVLGALAKAFEDYEEQREPAFQGANTPPVLSETEAEASRP